MRIQAKLLCLLADCQSTYEYRVSNKGLDMHSGAWMAGTRGLRCCSEKPSVGFDTRSSLLLVNINVATNTGLSVVKNIF